MDTPNETRIAAHDDVAESARGHEHWLSSESYWLPEHFVPGSAWNAHGPFAMWAVAAFRPRTIVELGTHYGFSYFTMCDVVRRLELPTKTWAIDSWEGDEHAGFYGDEVYDAVRAINAEYAEFSTLLRGYFAAKVGEFADGSIDLLHIDGRHRYEDVKEDFETYLPKMSSRGVVLFHDIAERHDDFGVWKFWEELSADYPSFAFEHGHGLGVLGVGSELPEAVVRFFAATEQQGGDIRATYARLGQRLDSLADHDTSFEGLHRRIHETEVQRNEVEAERDHALEEVEALRAEVERARTEAERAHRDAAAEVDRIRATLSWRVTAPLRAVRRGRSR